MSFCLLRNQSGILYCRGFCIIVMTRSTCQYKNKQINESWWNIISLNHSEDAISAAEAEVVNLNLNFPGIRTLEKFTGKIEVKLGHRRTYCIWMKWCIVFGRPNHSFEFGRFSSQPSMLCKENMVLKNSKQYLLSYTGTCIFHIFKHFHTPNLCEWHCHMNLHLEFPRRLNVAATVYSQTFAGGHLL